MFYDEVSAASTEEARKYFNQHKRDDVALIRVDFVGQSAPVTRDYAFLPVPAVDPQ